MRRSRGSMAARRAGHIGVALTFLTVSLAGAAHAAASGPPEAVIVEAPSVAAATDAVVAVGGTVDLTLPIVAGVAAHVRADGVATLEADPQLRVLPDVPLHATSASFHAVDARAGAAAPAVDPQIAALDPPAAWSPDAGHGVAVALIDTGVTDTPDLHGARLVRGPDFSGDGDGIDHYGHGTFMAGLIAGDGSASAGAPAGTPRHYGVAPGATLVSVKVAGADGSTSVSRVIAGIGWVVSHRDTYGIRVVNLSFGVDAPMPYRFNPLSAAVEAAWASGITVVVSAGNEGAGTVTSPGSDPYVITVGAADTTAAVDSGGALDPAAAVVPSWSGQERFHHYSKPEVVAPGVSVVSLRAPGSTIDVTHPEGRVDDVYFRGSGTSMSTALVAGAAAIVLADHPAATPDDVKGALVDGSTSIAGGAHEVDIARADTATARPDWWQHFGVAFGGLGIGLDHAMPWSAGRWTAARWTAGRWTAARWTTVDWTDTEWAAARWTAGSWDAGRWSAARWTAARWTAGAWPAVRWG